VQVETKVTLLNIGIILGVGELVWHSSNARQALDAMQVVVIIG